jgi:transposase InsO family protein
MIRQAYEQQNIEPGHVTIHADRGPAPAGKVSAQLLADLGLTKSHSRPRVSNDIPCSESQLKTMKYRPEFPDRFGSQPAALGGCVMLAHERPPASRVRENRKHGLGDLLKCAGSGAWKRSRFYQCAPCSP